MDEQISQAISQIAGADILALNAETIMKPEQNYLFGFSTAPIIQDIEAIEDEIDLKDAIKSLNEPGSIGLTDFKKKLGI